ncbi:kinase-like protein [Polyporus arcularius HHB13444]|uniref:Kinase-like protein n=1 Tax=Polyporus arcularius HHB13444 TaxID=1314778 RepID=A0A5C3PQP5_9APHY|nr:kinase-like protein [Polyporus arcularius HHB13444]
MTESKPLTVTWQYNKPLGYGAFADVFRATEQSSGTVVALKVARVSGKVKRTPLAHEGRVIQLLQGHPAVPTLVGYGRDPHFDYLALELLGGTLKKQIQEKVEALRISTVARISEQLLSALEHLASHGVVHRDINPANILLCPSDPSRIRLIDYGITRVLRPCSQESVRRFNASGQPLLVGTPDWCSLRVHDGYGDPRSRDDLESVAYTVTFLLFGGLPWRPPPGGESLERHISRIHVFKKPFGSAHLAKFPTVFAELLDVARSGSGDIKYDIAALRAKMLLLARQSGEANTDPLDWSTVASSAFDAYVNPDIVQDEQEQQQEHEQERTLHGQTDADLFDMSYTAELWDNQNHTRDASLTFPAEEHAVLDDTLPRIVAVRVKPA